MIYEILSAHLLHRIRSGDLDSIRTFEADLRVKHSPVVSARRPLTYHRWQDVTIKNHYYSFISLIASIAIFFTFINEAQLELDVEHASKNLSKWTTHCEIIHPLLAERQIDDEYSILGSLDVQNCTRELNIIIPTSFGDDIVIDLVKNERLISEKYFTIVQEGVDNLGQKINSGVGLPSSNEITNHKPEARERRDQFYVNHKFLSLHDYTSNNEHCHYNGIVNHDRKSICAISIIGSKLLSGYLNLDHGVFHLIADDTRNVTFILHANSPISDKFDLSECNQYKKSRTRRATNVTTKKRRFVKSTPENNVLHQPFQSNSSSLYVELLVVHDHSQYTDNKGNTSLIAERTMQIVNIMNAFYRQLNIFIALVGVVLWTDKDEIQLTEDGDSTLTNFLKYRYEKLLPRYSHDNAQLITSTSFNGSVVGKALKGPICTYDHSGGVNTDHSHNSAIIAVTLAHELGHNLGMEHDEDEKCKCPDEKCIMSSSSSFVHPKHWSSCSIEYLEESRKHGLLDCLQNKPQEIFGPVCGNGFVEEGEDCDIGQQIPSYGTSKSRYNRNSNQSQDAINMQNQTTKNPCCDRDTCKFTFNSTCAQGACCDLTTCSIIKATEAKICRHRKTDCDLEEICDGISEHCPQDVHYHDGLECGPTINLIDGQPPSANSPEYNRSRAYCFDGRCASHESQCQLLWGPSATTSRDICYDQNIHGNTSGNCGYNRRDKTFESCDTDHAMCGMLHCVHHQVNAPDRKTGKLDYGFESASILTVSFFVMSNHAKIYCHGAIIDAGPNMPDPGLVPNGAACDEERMCLNQKCVSVHEVLSEDWCPSDCNGNGICDNRGVCHCNDGTVGSSCYQFFGSNFHLSFLLYIIMFFGPIIGLIVLAFNHYRGQLNFWWLLQNMKQVLWSRSRRQPTRTRKMAYDANNHKIRMEYPTPLNLQGTANGVTFDINADPWGESSNHTGIKSPGYRLEPIKKQPPLPPLPDYKPQPDPVVHHPLIAPATQTTFARNEELRPVRPAPPPPVPPPVPPHRNISRERRA